MSNSNKKVESKIETTEKKKVSQVICTLKELAVIIKENNLTTVSSQIRYFDSLNHSRSSIAKTLNKRYQHVRNVLVENIKTNK